MKILKLFVIGIITFHVSGCESINIGKDLYPIDISRYSLPQKKFRISRVEVDGLRIRHTSEREIKAKLIESDFFTFADDGCALLVETDRTHGISGLTGILPLITLGIVPSRVVTQITLNSLLICNGENILSIEANSNGTEYIGVFSRLFGRSMRNSRSTMAAGIVSRIVRELAGNDNVMKMFEKNIQ